MIRRKVNKFASKRTRKGTSSKNKKRSSKKLSSLPKRRRDITLNDKLIMYLNEALSLENAAIERLNKRIKQTSLDDSRAQLKHHLEETKEQQNRLKDLISNLGGKATRDKGDLPIPSPSKSIENILKKHMTSMESELKGAKEDAIVESAEIVLYDMLIQLAQKASSIIGGDAIPTLTQNLSEERAMMDWIKANTPVLVSQLWPDTSTPVVRTEEGQLGIGEDQAMTGTSEMGAQ
jgi:ferritin-like metal-binding protein YciE